MDAKQREAAYQTKMQELIMYKSRCQNEVLQNQDRVSSRANDKHAQRCEKESNDAITSMLQSKTCTLPLLGIGGLRVAPPSGSGRDPHQGTPRLRPVDGGFR
eukprot:5874847-Pyramimonas_sp.AAC.1